MVKDNYKTNHFHEFFQEEKYLNVKNFLYNYLLRKRAVEKWLKDKHPEFILEVGSGISPLVIGRDNIVYSDISFEAIRILKRNQISGYYVVADGTHLPFKSNIYSHIICSEVLEHLPNDRQAISEMFRSIKKPHGLLIVTVPHRKRYYCYDDCYVEHYRRYEISELKDHLHIAGFQPIRIKKILGPLEKITMMALVLLFSMLTRGPAHQITDGKVLKARMMDLMVLVFKWINLFYKGYAWLDANIMPRSMATVILIESTVSRRDSKSNDRIDKKEFFQSRR